MSPSATLETSGMILEAGGAASVPLAVRNDRDVVDEYRFQVVGPLARWATVEPATVSVYPGNSATVTILFRVPRSCDALAGNAPYGVQVLPTQYPQDSVVAEGAIEVQPFYETTAELVPRTSEGKRGGKHRVAVDNRGNAAISVQLLPKDPEERLRLDLGSPTLRIAPGTAQSADLQVRPLRTIWHGAQTAHPFTVRVEPDGGPGTVLAGMHQQDPVLPGWSPKLLKYLVVLSIITAFIVAAVLLVTLVVGPGVGNLVSRVRPCVQEAAVGEFTACQELVGAGPQQGQADAEQQGQRGDDQRGDDQGGAGADEDLEEVTAELTARAGAERTDQDVFTAEDDGTVITRLVLNSSEGDTGVFNFTFDGAPFSQNLALEQFSGQEQPLDVRIEMAEGQQLGLNLRCDSADDERLQLRDACEVTAELRGVIVPPGQ